MGADCKSVGLAYEGSNPSPATPGTAAPPPHPAGAPPPPPPRGRAPPPGRGGGPPAVPGRGYRSRCGASGGRRAGAGDGGALQRPPAEEQPAEGDVDVAGAAHGHLGTVGLGRPRV